MLTLTHTQRLTRSATRSAHCSVRIRPGGPAAGSRQTAPIAGSKQFGPVAGARQIAPSALVRHSRELVAA
jgi:hypothetical protein